MPYQLLKLSPGIEVEQSAYFMSTGFNESVAARFFSGLPQKVGGFQHINSVLLTGTATGLHAWADQAGNAYIAIGTEQWLEIFYAGTLYNITPIRATTNNNPDFSTVINTKAVTIKDVGHGAVADDWVNINVPVSVGGIVLQGYYLIQTIVDSDNYTITAASNAASTVNNGGAVPSFTTTMSSADVTVTLANHGLIASDTFEVQVATTVGGITVAANIYSVIAPVTTNAFVIQPGGTAGSGATVFENGGHAQIQYLIHSGLASSEYDPASGGWGVGGWGSGAWGGGAGGGTILLPLRQWFLDNFGQDMVGNYTGSPIYLWVPPPEPGNVAIPIDTINFPSATSPPQTVNVSFVSAPQQMIIALGCDPVGGGDLQPLLLRWCDVGDFTDWVATVSNQAGSYTIPSGSMLVGGISAPNFNVIWTDIDMWLMSYLGGTGLSELVWGFTKVAVGVDLIAPRAAGVYRNVVYWPASNGFFAFDGNNLRLIPCPVWDKFWFNLNRTQIDKVNCQVNSWFQEVSWAFASATGDGSVDSRITYNIRENVWTYDDPVSVMARTAWIDDNVYGAPIGTDNSGYMQQHEVSNDADGMPLTSSVTTGWFMISEGTLFTFVDKLISQFTTNTATAAVQVTVYTQEFPTGPISTFGPFTWTSGSGPDYFVVRGRGRYAQVKVESSDLGSFWRLGGTRFLTSEAGRR